MDPVPHPAKYSLELYPILRTFLEDVEGNVLDPFAGVGRIHELHPRTVGIELEREWADQHEKTMVGNALHLPFPDDSFEAICTSPSYGNRLADTYTDHTRRITYTAYLGRKLSDDSSGAMQWGKKYRIFHEAVWAEASRVGRSRFVLNCKNHIRKGEIQPVTEWHIETLKALGWKHKQSKHIETPGHRDGENHEARIDYETVALFTR